MKKEDIKKEVRKSYGKIAKEGVSCCGAGCGCAESVSKGIGYSDKDIDSVPEGANLGLGCGNAAVIR